MFLIENAVVSYLIALESTDIYFVTLLYILQSICVGELCGHSNYSKPYGHGEQLINGLQFLRLKKIIFALFGGTLECWASPHLTETAASNIDISWLACRNEGPSIQAGPWWYSSVSIKGCHSHHLLVWWPEDFVPLTLVTYSTCRSGPHQKI